MHNLPISMVRLDSINFDENKFKISKNIIRDTLFRSISAHGILEEPVLINDKPHYTILTGHNRLKVLLGIGVLETACRIVASPVAEIIRANALMKLYHGILGPVGKLKYLAIMKEIAHNDYTQLLNNATTDFNIPAMVSRDYLLMQKIFNLPDSILDYIDLRDVGYKTICDLIALPMDYMQIINTWITQINMRVNIFREMIDMLRDLSRGEDIIDEIRKLDMENIEDSRMKENHVHHAIRKLRYPEYEKRMEIVHSLVSHLAGKGVRVEFPPFFEGDTIGLTFTASKSEGMAPLDGKMKNFDLSAAQRLLDQL